MKNFLKNNGLSLVLTALFIFSLTGQIITGLEEHNQEMLEDGGEVITIGKYLRSGHFLQSTFENWESEFLQMTLFLIFTASLFQKGSAESKNPEGENEVDREPNPKRKDVPGPVKKGGFVLKLYEHSLSLTLALLFLLSFLAHWFGSVKDYNEEQLLKGLPTETPIHYLSNSRLWFESFQNWQSEFLSVLAIVVLSIWLREKGSSQSKPVDAPHSETGS